MALIDTGACSQLLARLRKREEAYPFLKPVDWKKLKLDDYPEIITRPMDLQTLGRQLRDGQFEHSLESFFANLQLIWDNCKTYNGEDTEVYAMAESMERAAHELIRELFTVDNFPDYLLDPEDVEASKSSKRRRQRRTSDTSSASQEAPPPKRAYRQKAKVKQSTLKEEINQDAHIPLDPTRKALMLRIAQLLQNLSPTHVASVVAMIAREQDARMLPSDTYDMNRGLIDMAKVPTDGLTRISSVIKVLHLAR